MSNVDPTAGAFSSGIADVQSFVTGTAAPPLFGLAAVVTAISVGFTWFKKARRQAS